MINPGMVHAGGPAHGQRASYCMFYVDAAIIKQAARELGSRDSGPPELTKLVVNDPVTCQLLMSLYSQMVIEAEPLAKQSALAAALARLVHNYGNGNIKLPRPGREHRAVGIIKEYLHQHLSKKVSLHDLAKETGLSRFHLLRVFKRSTGLSPHAYHLQQRIEAAKLHLLKGVPIAETALQTGFVDQSHLSNHFKKIVGATPGQFLAA